MPSLGTAVLDRCPHAWDPEASCLSFLVGGAGDGSSDEGAVTLVSTVEGGGPALRCHEGLLRARCPAAPAATGGGGDGASIEVGEPPAVLFALLRWVFCEAVDADAQDAEPQTGVCSDVAVRAVRLGRSWGLRDRGSFQARVAAGHAVERARGSLAADVLRAYDAGELSDGWRFQADEGEPLPGGCAELLRSRSNYFRAMLSGRWAEGRLAGSQREPVQVHCPRVLLERLLRFLHGAAMVEGSEDLRAALDCGTFFEVPSLVAHAGDWIAAHLTVETAPGLWKVVEAERALGGHEDLEEADSACFEFHLRNFEKLAGLDADGREAEDGLEDEEGPTEKRPAPVLELSPALLRRLLSSGLLAVPSEELKVIVKTFARAHTRGQPPSAYSELLETLRPPAVLFNRDTRNSLVYNRLATASLFASLG